MKSRRDGWGGLILAAIALSGCGTAAPPAATLGPGQIGMIRFASGDVSNRDFLEGNQTTTPVVIAGHLQIPSAAGAARAPAVVLMHGCSGWSGADEGWAQELPRLGIATFRIDSFSGRGIREACTGQSQIGLGSRVVDAYRALELLATHPQIDPERIALMGFSQGGGVTLRAAMTRFQRAWAPPGRRFAAYLAFYPAGCWFTLIDDVLLDARPVRIFHGMADDWTPVGPCRDHVDRARRAGSDIAIMEYPGAHHGFDNRQLPPAARRPDVLNPGHCQWIEELPGRVIDRETGRPASADAPCVRRGATVGYQAHAYRQALQDVGAFLRATFQMAPAG